ncbi:N-formylglutamate deformylase [Salinisphaera sp. SPP-AMP-43]|uniref:N-formylglutamate deformylase n=1 Tax=Salinisphaera sp. SPP-AMP-43 TaxID=3121288 RepID=UPI003C6DC1ED
MTSSELSPFDFYPGSLPLLVSFPHAGTFVPQDLHAAMSKEAAGLPDTDWHLDRLYDFVHERGSHVIRANYSRYVVDLNRPPDDAPLYTGATTGLMPEVQFDGTPIFAHEPAPDRSAYLDSVWRPYHDKIRSTLEALRAEHGYAILFDAHSIRSVIPRLFEGQLPDFNIGTHESRSLDADLEARLCDVCASQPPYTSVLNGRFKGGYTTRHYGEPARNIHAVQLELSQRTYMEEQPPFAYREDLAAQVQPALQAFVETLIDWQPAQK